MKSTKKSTKKLPKIVLPIFILAITSTTGILPNALISQVSAQSTENLTQKSATELLQNFLQKYTFSDAKTFASLDENQKNELKNVLLNGINSLADNVANLEVNSAKKPISDFRQLPFDLYPKFFTPLVLKMRAENEKLPEGQREDNLAVVNRAKRIAVENYNKEILGN